MPGVEQGPRGLAARSPVGRPRVPTRAVPPSPATAKSPAAPPAEPPAAPPPAPRPVARRTARTPEPAPAAPATRPRRRTPAPADDSGKPSRRRKAEPGTDLVPMTTVDAMERLSGELYVAGQRAARAEAVAEMRLRRLGEVEERSTALEQEVERLREERQELLQRLALAEARVMVLDDAPPPRWGLRRRG